MPRPRAPPDPHPVPARKRGLRANTAVHRRFVAPAMAGCGARSAPTSVGGHGATGRSGGGNTPAPCAARHIPRPSTTPGEVAAPATGRHASASGHSGCRSILWPCAAGRTRPPYSSRVAAGTGAAPWAAPSWGGRWRARTPDRPNGASGRSASSTARALPPVGRSRPPSRPRRPGSSCAPAVARWWDRRVSRRDGSACRNTRPSWPGSCSRALCR